VLSDLTDTAEVTALITRLTVPSSRNPEII